MPVGAADILWRASLDYRVLIAHAEPASLDKNDLFDLGAVPAPVTIVTLPSGQQEASLGDPASPLRISIREGTLTNGPVHLSFRLNSDQRLPAQIAALREFDQWRLKRLPEIRPHPTMAKWHLLIKTMNILAEDRSYRDIATALFSEDYVERTWNQSSDFLKSRIRRLVHQARYLASGGYRNMLSASRVR